MSAGLSGTYDSACSARSSVDNKEKVHVFNSKTLCGPHRYMVEKASELSKENKTVDEIIEVLDEASETEISFLIPFDFSFLVNENAI